MSGVAIRYRAVTSAGEERSGLLPNTSRGAALQVLHQQGLIPLDIAEHSDAEPVSSEPARRASSRRSRVSAHDLQGLCQNIASLLAAGLTIDRALQITGRVCTERRLAALSQRLLGAVRSGQTLTQAFAGAALILPPYFLSMIEAGETGGVLPQALGRLAELQQQHLALRERIRSALIYPAILVAVLIVTLVVLLTFVLPRFELLFAESTAPLPTSTQVVLWLGRSVADHWQVMLLVSAAVFLAALKWLRTTHGTSALHRWLLRSRWTMSLPQSLNTARLLRTVASLCQSGVPLPQALRVARGTLSNVHLRHSVESVVNQVQAGETFSSALERTGQFPELAVQLTRVGEETGQLPPLLLSAAESLEREAQRTLDRLLAVSVPLITVVMGAVVAGLIGSVLIGLLSINELAM